METPPPHTCACQRASEVGMTGLTYAPNPNEYVPEKLQLLRLTTKILGAHVSDDYECTS